VKGDPVICSRNIFERYQRIALNDRESFHAVSLNARNRITGEWKISEGSLHQCALSPRDIFSVLMREGSFQVIFIHNHPSGDPVPSQEDIEFTSRLVKAGSILGIKVLDHIIIAGNSYTSLKDEGKITM
jgi:DNA repair protein RadC